MHAKGCSLLLSDVHLSTEAPEITRRFFKFLHSQTSHCQALFILGDLFELWIGDDAPGTLGLEVAVELRQLAGNGISLFFMHGNRDFLIGPDYAAQAGMQLLEDPCIVYFNQQPVLLSHGDAWCTDDVEYQAFRSHRLKPEVRQAFLAQSEAERVAFAKNARDASRQHTQNSAAGIMDVNQAVIQEVFAGSGVDTIIHGHTHRPADHTYHDVRQRLVLGDWYSQASWLEIDTDGIHRHGGVI